VKFIATSMDAEALGSRHRRQIENRPEILAVSLTFMPLFKNM